MLPSGMHTLRHVMLPSGMHILGHLMPCCCMHSLIHMLPSVCTLSDISCCPLVCTLSNIFNATLLCVHFPTYLMGPPIQLLLRVPSNHQHHPDIMQSVLQSADFLVLQIQYLSSFRSILPSIANMIDMCQTYRHPYQCLLKALSAELIHKEQHTDIAVGGMSDDGVLHNTPAPLITRGSIQWLQ